MTYGSDRAIENLNAGAANFTSDIMRSVADREQRAKALTSLGHALAFAVAGVEIVDTRPAPRRFTA